MSDMSARLSTWFRGGENRDSGGGCRAGYGLVVSFVTMLVFCVLIATVSVWKAFVFAALAFAAFGIGECLAPESWRVGRRRGGAAAERDPTAGAPQAAAYRFGLSKAAIDALPAFAYESRGAEGGGGGDVDVESAGSGDPLCSVCLEDLQASEMVRQLPACKHLFHVECIDMWLHSHRTCPICRCDLSPPRKITAKMAAVETEPPAVDALPPV